MTEKKLITAARKMARECNALKFGGAAAWIYNPLDYAWAVHRQYIERFGASQKKVLLLGMNPGPFGMMQTGVPFGEVAAVRDWMQLSGKVKQPDKFHPKRPIQGFDCTRAEVSGARLWSWAADNFGSADEFFADFFVVNYCPLVFLEESGRNLTPDKLKAKEQAALGKICDAHLATVIKALQPQWAIGVGAYAAKRLSTLTGAPIEKGHEKSVPTEHDIRIGQVLHPSPASPLANRGWAEAAQKTFKSFGLV